MSFIPQIATEEISEADLDNLSGGLAGGAGTSVAAGVEGPVTAGVTLTADGGGSVDTSGITGLVPGL